MKAKQYKAKRCQVCETDFMPFRFCQKVCSPKCASDFVLQANAKKARVENKKRKRDLKTNGQLIKEAQREFNKVRRLEDKDEPCISCGRYDHEIDGSWMGGKWDCGHYLSVGSHPELRFEPLNAHKQCKSCNGGSGKYTRKGHTVAQDYRENLIKKIGI